MLKRIHSLLATVNKQATEMDTLNVKLKESNERFLQMVEECKLKVNVITELERDNKEFEKRLK